MFGAYPVIFDNDFHEPMDHRKRPASKPVIIENHVWIGHRVTILPGVRIGAEAVVGAGSVVMKDVPPRTIVSGNPARVIRWLDSPGDLDTSSALHVEPVPLRLAEYTNKLVSGRRPPAIGLQNAGAPNGDHR